MSRSFTKRTNMQPQPYYRSYGERDHYDRYEPEVEPKHQRSKRNNPSHQRHNKAKMDSFREKKGNANRAIRQEEIKKELFVGIDDEAMSRLAEPQTVQPIMLPVTSRGVGMSTTQLAYTARQYGNDIRVPSIYAQYRVYLGLLEAKVLSLKSQFTMIPRFTDVIYQHEGMTPSILKILKTCTMVPVAIQKIIDAVGILTHDDKVYLPVVAKTENANGLILRPENLMLSSLREVVEDLSDPDTPLLQRQRFYQNCPIPGAIWDNHILINPNEIMPENYDFEVKLRADILQIAPFLSRLQKYAPKMVGGALDPKKVGRPSLFLSNEMETLRVPNRNVGENLDAYYDRCIVEGNVTHYTSAVKLTPAERIEGQITLLGEQPSVVNMMRPLYLARDETLHPYWMQSDFTGVCQIMYAM